jgi:hypothetical protein
MDDSPPSTEDVYTDALTKHYAEIEEHRLSLPLGDIDSAINDIVEARTALKRAEDRAADIVRSAKTRIASSRKRPVHSSASHSKKQK